MRKNVLILLSMQFCVALLHAQKKFFFESIEINSYVYTDDLVYPKNAWPKQLKPGFHPSAQNFDSLDYFEVFKEWFHVNVTGGGGIQARLQKLVPTFPTNSRNKLEWNTGLGFRTFRMKSISYSYQPFHSDTSQIYFREGELFQLRQSFIDVYNSVVLNHHSKIIPEMYGFVGFGFQTSFSISSKVRDAYSSGKQKWNTSQRRWEEISATQDTTLVPARNNMLYAWTIPLGIGFDLSKEISIAGGIEYLHARHSPALAEKKYSEGAMFQLIIRYKL